MPISQHQGQNHRNRESALFSRNQFYQMSSFLEMASELPYVTISLFPLSYVICIRAEGLFVRLYK